MPHDATHQLLSPELQWGAFGVLVLFGAGAFGYLTWQLKETIRERKANRGEREELLGQMKQLMDANSREQESNRRMWAEQQALERAHCLSMFHETLEAAKDHHREQTSLMHEIKDSQVEVMAHLAAKRRA